MADYASLSNEELLEVLEQAGRLPAPKLMAACLDRGDALVPGLLGLLEAGLQNREDRDTWPQDDSRWYVPVHVGRLLMAQQVVAALPLLHAYLRQEGDWLSEWYEGDELAYFGPEAVPDIRAILDDEGVIVYARWTAADSLSALATTHPELRDTVCAALHDVLPGLCDDGTPDVPETPDEDDVVLWTAILLNLAYLGDGSARPVARALHQADLIDEMMYGDVDEFERILTSQDERHTVKKVGDYDLVAEYRHWRSSELAERHRQEAYERRQARAKVDEGQIGRNDHITIRQPATGETIEGIKYKHALKKLAAGWEVVAAG